MSENEAVSQLRSEGYDVKSVMHVSNYSYILEKDGFRICASHIKNCYGADTDYWDVSSTILKAPAEELERVKKLFEAIK